MWVRKARAPRRRLLQRKGKVLALLTVKVKNGQRQGFRGERILCPYLRLGLRGILSRMGFSSGVKLDCCEWEC